MQTSALGGDDRVRRASRRRRYERELIRGIRRPPNETVKLKVIFNPAAGRGRALRHAEEAESLLRALGAEIDLHPSTSPADLTKQAAESSRGEYDRVVVCGGDGTLNLAVREFDLVRGTLALIPLGSGNDFARVLGIPRNIRAACELAVRGDARSVDVALANGLRYLGVAGLGFDSEVASYANADSTVAVSASPRPPSSTTESSTSAS